MLVGLPGSGKSTVGRAAAEHAGCAFLDFDVEIERREVTSIARLFAERGEAYFRARERDLTAELRARDGMVLAPGGGWVTNPEVVAMLRPPARIVYLRATPESALLRLGDARASRPLLLRPDPLGELRRLLDARRAAYEIADHVIDTELLPLQGVVEEVARLARAGA